MNLVNMVRATHNMKLLQEAKQRQVDLGHKIRLQDMLDWDPVDEDDLDYTRHSTP